MNKPYFNSDKLPKPKEAYVAWVDVMGIQGSMMRSVHAAANFIYKLHVAALEEPRVDVVLYPVMDGVYIVSESKDKMRSYLAGLFSRLALGFSGEATIEYRFVVKGAVAFGPIIHGCDVDISASNVLKSNVSYKDSILLGMPMVLANQMEKSAPPFGVAIHHSALGLLEHTERVKSHCWWPWFGVKGNPTAKSLKTDLADYYSWCEARAGQIDYDASRVKVHKQQFEQYFVDV